MFNENINIAGIKARPGNKKFPATAVNKKNKAPRFQQNSSQSSSFGQTGPSQGPQSQQFFKNGTQNSQVIITDLVLKFNVYLLTLFCYEL